MSGLDGRQRTALSRLVVRARVRLFDDAQTSLRGAYGILPDGTIQDEKGLAADPALRARRRTLEGVIAHLSANASSPAAAVERLTREVAFTHLNRLLAIRVADALGVLAPSLRDGTESAGFRQWITDLAPLLATADDTGGYWTYLAQCADELAVDAPALFDPRNPLLALRPSRAALDEVVALLADPAGADLWSADDTFGWAYQFFNTREEVKELRKSSAPRDTRELAVRNQFFTPDYIVRFLVHNTLGRRLVDADPSTPLLDRLALLVDPPTTRGAPIDLAQIKVLDPACGSGHFLLGCYDVLEAAWELAGVAPAEAAQRIVPCLWGIDIDPRAVQVAQAAVIFRARRACGRAPLPPPNIVCARALPEDEAAWDAAATGLGADVRRLVESMRSALREAPVLGSLLKVEQRLASEIRSTVAGAGDAGDDLFATSGIAQDAFGKAERSVVASLQLAADATSATPAEQLLAAGATDAVHFIEAMRNSYDAVLMNPPFGEPIPSTKEYIKAAYPWIPTRDYNLLAAFVGRGLELCKRDGYVGAITTRAGMFLTTSKTWRAEVILGNQLIALADLGYGVMEDAEVEAAAYVLSPKPPTHDHEGVYIRLLKDADRPAGLATAVAADRNGEDDPRVFHVPNDDFDAIPGSPMAYWMGDSIRRLFTDFPRIEGNGGDVRVGLQTGDDFRFLRLFWEADPRSIAQNRDATLEGKRWVPFAKGGEYSPNWFDIYLLVNYESDGQTLRDFPGSVVRNPQYYFQPGLTWPRRTTSGFGVRVMPAGGAFGDKGPAVLSRSDLPLLLAFMRWRFVQAAMDAQVSTAEEVSSGGTSRSYEVGLVQGLPWPGDQLGVSARTQISKAMMELLQICWLPDLIDETSRSFVTPLINGVTSIEALVEQRARHREDRTLAALMLTDEIESLFADELDIDEAGRAYLDEEVTMLPTRYPDDAVADDEALNRLLEIPIADAIDEMTAEVGGSRTITRLFYFYDRRIEVLSHFFRRHPRVIVQGRRASGIVERGARQVVARDIVSWLVGLAFGRWDARASSSGEPQFDPFSPIPLRAPGMLVGPDDGLATTSPPDYPITVPPDGLLIDQPGHPLDFVKAVDDAARLVGDDCAALLEDAVRTLDARTLRSYLSQKFFRAHLRRYSTRGRQAPVYWQLTIPSGGWSAWLYAPRFGREMLYALVTLADHRLASATSRIQSLEEASDGSARQRAKAIDAERALVAELREMRDDVARLAGLGWQPDLDDGFVLCAAPLARWFPKTAWRQLADQLAAIRRGDYPWATVHQFRDVL